MSENEQFRPKSSRGAADVADGRAAPDRRVARTRRQILDATVELMATRGLDGLTMDAVAEAADVSRSTLYRHWPQLADLLADGVQHLGDQIVIGTTVAVEEDTFEQCVAAKAQAIGQRLRDPELRRLIATLGIAAEHNADAATAHEQWVASSRDGVAEYVRACGGMEGVDPHWVSDLVLGPIFMNAMVLHLPMTDDQIRTHVTRTLTLARHSSSVEGR